MSHLYWQKGLQFFYRHILNKPWQWVEIVKPPKVRTLPDILTPAEVSRVMNQTREARYQTYLLCVYSVGLRLSEALNLTIADIDSAHSKVHVRCDKGRKDRFVFLPDCTLDMLRRYWASHRNPVFIFPRGKTNELRYSANTPMDRGGLQKSIKIIVTSCGIHKRVTIHTFRCRDNKQQTQTRSLGTGDFLKLVLQHVLPKGFRRVRDYGFLHGDAKATLKRVQWALQVAVPPIIKRERPKWQCPHCGGVMHIISVYRRRFDNG